MSTINETAFTETTFDPDLIPPEVIDVERIVTERELERRSEQLQRLQQTIDGAIPASVACIYVLSGSIKTEVEFDPDDDSAEVPKSVGTSMMKIGQKLNELAVGEFVRNVAANRRPMRRMVAGVAIERAALEQMEIRRKELAKCGPLPGTAAMDSIESGKQTQAVVVMQPRCLRCGHTAEACPCEVM